MLSKCPRLESAFRLLPAEVCNGNFRQGRSEEARSPRLAVIDAFARNDFGPGRGHGLAYVSCSIWQQCVLYQASFADFVLRLLCVVCARGDLFVEPATCHFATSHASHPGEDA